MLVVTFHDVRCHGVVAVITKISFCWWWVHVIHSACKLLVCPSNLMRSNHPWSSSLHHSFSVSVVLVQSHRACVVCWAVLSPMNLFYICPSHQEVLGDEKKLSMNILCPKLLTLQVKCLTIACVAALSSVAECESLLKYTLMSYVYPDSSHSL